MQSSSPPRWWEGLDLVRRVVRACLLWGKLWVVSLLFRHADSSLESKDVTTTGDSIMRDIVCMTLEFAPYRRRRCFISVGGSR